MASSPGAALQRAGAILGERQERTPQTLPEAAEDSGSAEPSFFCTSATPFFTATISATMATAISAGDLPPRSSPMGGVLVFWCFGVLEGVAFGV